MAADDETLAFRPLVDRGVAMTDTRGAAFTEGRRKTADCPDAKDMESSRSVANNNGLGAAPPKVRCRVPVLDGVACEEGHVELHADARVVAAHIVLGERGGGGRIGEGMQPVGPKLQRDGGQVVRLILRPAALDGARGAAR